METTLQLGRTRNGWWRLQAMVFAPSAALQDISKNPTWLLALLGVTAVGMVRLFVFYSPSKAPEKVAVTALAQLVSASIPILVCAGVFFLALCLCGAETSFKKVFSVLCHTFFIYTLINVLLASGALLLASDHKDVSPANPVMSNLGFFDREHPHSAVNFLLSSCDAIVFYHLFLIALGLSTVAKGISAKAAAGIVFGIWVIYVALIATVKFIVA